MNEYKKENEMNAWTIHIVSLNVIIQYKMYIIFYSITKEHDEWMITLHL